MHGATKWVMSFASELQIQGHESSIYCPRLNIKKPYWLKSKIISTNKKYLPGNKIIKIGKNYLDTFMLIKDIPKDTDILILHSEISVLLAPALKFKCKSAKLVYYCYQPPREIYDLWDTVKVDFSQIQKILLSLIIPIYKRIDKYCVRKCDLTLVWSEQYKTYTKEIYGKSLKVKLLPAGIDFKIFRDADKSILESLQSRYSEFDYKLLINSAITRKKNIPKFINLVSNLNKAGFCTIGIVIGEGELLSEMKKIATDLGVIKNLDFVGYVSQEELPCYYLLSDVVYYLEKNGAWSLSIIEAGAANKPVIAAEGGSMATLINHGKTGFILSSNNEESQLIKFSKILLESAKIRDEYGLQGNLLTNEYSLENITKKFQSYI